MILNMAGAGGGASFGFPKFTYTGQYSLIDDGKVNGKQNWRIKFLTSGTFKATTTLAADVFCVGGGGGGGTLNNTEYPGSDYCGGGGGGYTTTSKRQNITAGTSYTITIGAGGAQGVNGGKTSAFGTTAAGGYSSKVMFNAGKGGSGGGAGTRHGLGGEGGSDGGDGGKGNWTNGQQIAQGQGTTTREFGESSGTLYAGGGGGSSNDKVVAGGAGGGGAGGRPNTNGLDGVANTGGGGGGRYGSAAGSPKSGSGGSGIVVIRNAR